MSLNQWMMKFACAIALLGALSVTACNQDANDKINQAQQCLDNTSDANYANAANCESYLEGLTSQQAYVVKCAAEFLKNGITTTRIANAAKQLQGSNAQSVYITMLAIEDTSAAQTLVDVCTKSQVESLIFLASMSQIGSTLAHLGGVTFPSDLNNFDSGDIDTTTLKNNLEACANGDASCDSTTTTAIGQAAITAGSSYCDQADANGDICKSITSAINSGDGSAASVGQYLAGCLKDPNSCR